MALRPTNIDPTLAELHLPPVRSIEPLTGGSADVFLLHLSNGSQLVLKTFASENVNPHKDAYAAGLLNGLNVPVTRYLLVDDSLVRLPYRFALTTYLDGQPAQHVLNHHDMPALFEQIGALAKKLHAVHLPAFGELPQPAFRSNADYVRTLVASALERFRFYGADPLLAGKLEENLRRSFDRIVPESLVPVFAHDDLQPNNVLVAQHNGRLAVSGLIDLGNARANSSVMDLSKTIFCCEHASPGCGEHILTGYGSVDHSCPTEALAYYTTLHRIIMWWWLRHIGVLATADAVNDIMPALDATAAGS
jgi:Ser/Thr protein kinase RdoA (MazF antagonist)